MCNDTRTVTVLKSDGTIYCKTEMGIPPYDLTYNMNLDRIIVSLGYHGGIKVMELKKRKTTQTIDVYGGNVFGIVQYESSVLCCTNQGVRMINLKKGSNSVVCKKNCIGGCIDVFND